MTDVPPGARRWPVAAAVAPAAALIFSGAAAWASITAPPPASPAGESGSASQPAETDQDRATAQPFPALQARLDTDRRRLDRLRDRITELPDRTGAAAAAPEASAPQLAPARPRPAAPPPPVDTSTGASG